MLGFEPPLSGPGPVVNTKRTRTGTSDTNLLDGDYTNPILKPAAAEIVKKCGEISQSGVAFPDPDAMCMYEPVPYILWNFEIQIIQRPDEVTILYNHDHEFRKVRMNQPHPAKVVPSAHGDSVGHYEGDTLVIDTVAVKVGPYTMIDRPLGFERSEHVIGVILHYETLYRAARSVVLREGVAVRHLEAAEGDLDRREPGFRHEISVGRYRSIRCWRVAISFFDKCAAHGEAPLLRRSLGLGRVDLL